MTLNGFNYRHRKDSFMPLSHEVLAAPRLLTHEVVHHLWRVVGCGGDAQQLLPPAHGGVIDCLDVDVMSAHELITDLRVFSSICNLSLMMTEGKTRTGRTTS